MRCLLAIDPGVKVAGLAMFESRTLARVSISVGVHISDHLANVDSWGAHDVVLERMSWRPSDPKSNPNDLLDVQLVGAAIAGACRTTGEVYVYTASVWKSSIPKKVHHIRIRGALDPFELEILDRALERTPIRSRKEILDAVGLGLYHLRRTDRAGRRLG